MRGSADCRALSALRKRSVRQRKQSSCGFSRGMFGLCGHVMLRARDRKNHKFLGASVVIPPALGKQSEPRASVSCHGGPRDDLWLTTQQQLECDDVRDH